MDYAAARAVRKGEQSQGGRVWGRGVVALHGGATPAFGQGGACREEAEVDRPSTL
jgi:hypothetical protein